MNKSDDLVRRNHLKEVKDPNMFLRCSPMLGHGKRRSLFKSMQMFSKSNSTKIKF